MSARSFANTVGVVLVTILMPALVYAQASITGVVRDTSGAVLPGVTVEAASPALIEKVRSAVTDGTGQYRIENLRPGIYPVTFTLPGLLDRQARRRRTAGTFTATINADLRVGEICGDHHRHRRVAHRGRPEHDAAAGDQRRGHRRHPDRAKRQEPRAADSRRLDSPAASARTSAARRTRCQLADDGTRQPRQGPAPHLERRLAGHHRKRRELAHRRHQPERVSGSHDRHRRRLRRAADRRRAHQLHSARTAATGSPARSFLGFGNGSMQGDNFTDELQAAGLGTPNSLKRLWDFNPGLGGPIMRDRLWFYAAYKDHGHRDLSGRRVREPQRQQPQRLDLRARPAEPAVQCARRNRTCRSASPGRRLPKLKTASPIRKPDYCGCTDGINATTAPEAALYRTTHKQRNLMGDWTVPLTNRLLIDGAFVHRHQDQGRTCRPERAIRR